MSARKKLVLANWKMNLDVPASLRLTRELAERLPAPVRERVELVLAPSYVALWPLRETCAAAGFRLSAQDVYQEAAGPCCGAVSAGMLKGLCEYVVIGHSDRRIRFGDTDELVNRKVLAALDAGLKPVICLGETLQARRLGLTGAYLESQLRYALEGVHDISAVTLLYEPVWALGTGQSLDGESAGKLAFFLRSKLASLYGAEAGACRILYAGSVSPGNAADYACRGDIDGAALGSSALSAESICHIAAAFAAEAGGLNAT